MQVSLNSVLSQAQYAKVKTNVKEVLAARLNTYSANLTLTKTSSTSLRVVAGGKVKCHVNMASDLKEINGHVVGAIEIMMLGSSTKQLLKVNAPVVKTTTVKAKAAVRTGWSFTVLLSMVAGLSVIVNVAKAFM